MFSFFHSAMLRLQQYYKCGVLALDFMYLSLNILTRSICKCTNVIIFCLAQVTSHTDAMKSAEYIMRCLLCIDKRSAIVHKN